jgi:membrane protease YdiL (CAAX protease family)
LKDAARLLAYFFATVLFGALAAPVLWWAAQALIARGHLTFIADKDFQTFFHRALLVGALLFLWPLMRSLKLRGWRELGLEPNANRWRDVGAGVLIAAVPLLCLAVVLVQLGVYSMRSSVAVLPILERGLSAVVVPFIEEPLFRGLILGVLLRAGATFAAKFSTSAFFSIIHFLKAPENSATEVTWTSGFASLGNAFHQFQQPLLVAGGFTTLFLLAWILSVARMRTRSLWLPIGLHGGWIFAAALFNKVARRQMEVLPWIGKNLLGGAGAAGSCTRELGDHAPLAEACGSWETLSRSAHSSGCSTRSSAPSARNRPPGANTSAASAPGKRHASSRPSVPAAQSRSTATSRTSSPARNCAHRILHFDAAVAAFRSRGVVRQIIHRFKYSHDIHLRFPIADWLAATLEDPRFAGRRFDVVIPVPLHPTRKRERGFQPGGAARGDLQPPRAPAATAGAGTHPLYDHANSIRPRRTHRKLA